MVPRHQTTRVADVLAEVCAIDFAGLVLLPAGVVMNIRTMCHKCVG
jgi:hypothetical protein